MKQLQIAIVTGHAESILIPLLQLKPDEVLLIASDKMASQLDRCAVILKDQLPQGTIIEKRGGLADNEPEAIAEYAEKLAQELADRADIDDYEVLFNSTGGTKMMSLLFQEALRSCYAKVLYLDSDAGQIYKLGDTLAPEHFVSIPIEPVLDLKLYLRINGKNPLKASSDDAGWRELVQGRKTLTKYFAKNAVKRVGLLGNLNFMILAKTKHSDPVLIQAKGKLAHDELAAYPLRSLKNKPRGLECDILRQCAESGLIGWDQEKPTEIYFNSVDAAKYLSGNWLEEYTWHCMQDAGLEDIACSLAIGDQKGKTQDVRNEFDCVAVHKNRMLVLECKTSKLGHNEDGKDQDILHKLYSITEQSAGLYGSKVLVLARDFDDNNDQKTNLQRAKIMGVNVVATAQLQNLPKMLRAWKETGRFE